MKMVQISLVSLSGAILSLVELKPLGLQEQEELKLNEQEILLVMVVISLLQMGAVLRDDLAERTFPGADNVEIRQTKEIVGVGVNILVCVVFVVVLLGQNIGCVNSY